MSPLQKCLSLFANFFLLSWNVSETESLNNNSPEPLANAKLAGPLDNANPAGPLDNAIDFVAPHHFSRRLKMYLPPAFQGDGT